jgi:biotin carboxyl carrier protein
MTDKINSNKGSDNKKLTFKKIIIHGEEYTTTLTKKYESIKKWVKPNNKLLYSYIPGTITEIYVKEGQSLNKGEKILLLEAMKMLNSITMPLSCKIKKINVKVGDKIPKGFLMVEFE